MAVKVVKAVEVQANDLLLLDLYPNPDFILIKNILMQQESLIIQFYTENDVEYLYEDLVVVNRNA